MVQSSEKRRKIPVDKLRVWQPQLLIILLQTIQKACRLHAQWIQKSGFSLKISTLIEGEL